MLIVEDNLLIALETRSLVEQCGWAVVGPVSDVEDALRAARDTELQGAILDINLAGERVWPVADLLQERGTPFVFATGYDEAEVPQRFSAHSILTKPLTLVALRRAIDRLGPCSR